MTALPYLSFVLGCNKADVNETPDNLASHTGSDTVNSLTNTELSSKKDADAVADMGITPSASSVTMPPPDSAMTATQKADTTARKLGKQGPCMPGMVEISGTYCQTVLHHCIKDGRSYNGHRDTAPMPYHCKAYLQGAAKCYGTKTPMHFCMDIYEYPNHKGAIGHVFVSWTQAQELCKHQGKRLCNDDEWTLACEGPDRKPYPYGWTKDASKCNIENVWRKPDDGILSRKKRDSVVETELARLSQAVPSGSMPECVSDYGVYDMTGNIDEWTVNVTGNNKPYRSAFKGGHWCRGARNRCRPSTKSHDESTRYYAEGFRCCADITKNAADSPLD